ncbi:MAG: TraR/DksA C4-type zinc finger protein [Clostridia bacterium]|nr:TraR/DksA C4-type zinc finger protein [Clostridia bacterium]
MAEGNVPGEPSPPQDARRRLERELARLEDLAARLGDGGLNESQAESLEELSAYDNHPADLGSETFERSKDLALRRLFRSNAERVREALRRLEAGTYGLCVRCGRPIAAERLVAAPEADLCLACRQAVEAEGERERRRPVEEEVLGPPFARTFDRLEGSAYDGEDAWQDVARYGTSETPQDVPDNAGYDAMYADADERRGAVGDLEGLVDRQGDVVSHDGEPLA